MKLVFMLRVVHGFYDSGPFPTVSHLFNTHEAQWAINSNIKITVQQSEQVGFDAYEYNLFGLMTDAQETEFILRFTK